MNDIENANKETNKETNEETNEEANKEISKEINNETDNKNIKLAVEKENYILDFIKAMPDLIAIETLKKSYRITSQGLFVELQETENFISLFSKTTNTPKEKLKKNLFKDKIAPIYYLLEGKNCLTGRLVSITIKNPQQFKLPYYLGSLTDAKTYLHPHDLELQSVSGLTILGNDIKFKKGNFEYTITQDLLKRFNHFIGFSPIIIKRFPSATMQLKQTLRAFIILFKKAHYIHNTNNMLIPEKYISDKSQKYAVQGSLVFVFNKENKIIDFYETKGKNLYHFMRKEFEKIKPTYLSEKTGTFKPYLASNKFLGMYTLNGKNISLNPFAFFSFLEQAPTMKSMEVYFKNAYTTQKAFEVFSYFFINSSPIDAKNIRNYIEKLGKYAKKYFINQQWIFGIDKKQTLTVCIAKGFKKSY
ncbi:MAG: hypothetical protein ACOX3T_05710 [Bdellovibrionota bacterium]